MIAVVSGSKNVNFYKQKKKLSLLIPTPTYTRLKFQICTVPFYRCTRQEYTYGEVGNERVWAGTDYGRTRRESLPSPEAIENRLRTETGKTASDKVRRNWELNRIWKCEFGEEQDADHPTCLRVH